MSGLTPEQEALLTALHVRCQATEPCELPRGYEDDVAAALALLAAAPSDDDLGAAWREAEAALPEYWFIRSLLLSNPYTQPTWEVVAAEGGGSRKIVIAHAPTPAAALLALAARLREAT